MLRTGLPLLLLLAGCKVFDASLIEPGGDAGPTDAAMPDTGTSQPDAGPVATCPDGTPLRRPPARPTSSDSGDQQLVMGLRDIRLRQTSEAWRDIGLDLDGLCTNTALSDVECQPPSDVGVQIDGNAGIDNAFHSLFDVIDLVFPSLASTAGMVSAGGVGVVVLQIDGWNGMDDDAQVDVRLTQSVAGTTGGADDEAAPPVEFVNYEPFVPGTMTPLDPPAWDGNDWLWVREETFFMGDTERPRVRDTNAYIANRQLVMRLPDRAEIIFAGEDQGINVQLTDAYVIGTFDETFTRLSPVTVAGRWSVLDLLETASSVNICSGDTEYDILQRKLDEVADVRATPNTGGPTATCDAVSIGVTFEGYRVRIAGLEPGNPLPDGCE
ncbi:MAG: hypothetical protein H6722_16320 [Sandaracinus sp.]|nr:hypothetical protein [Myxococcales bacterium]MCB9603383.1 hypothetical protein [Sandaracinus sp.]MCB9614006.1 hypothetical protein [Sandaracinus sp.]MCB9624329.1 hypothetical protein [Sandaracinus sp.]